MACEYVGDDACVCVCEYVECVCVGAAAAGVEQLTSARGAVSRVYGRLKIMIT